MFMYELSSFNHFQLFGPVEKTDLCLVSSMEVIDALSVLKSLTEQIVYLNDTGIVLNNSFVDNACSPVFNDHQIILYKQSVCIFDITNSILDAIPCSFDLLDIQQINPLVHALDQESLIAVPKAVFKQIGKELSDHQKGLFPSVLGDSLRLGVLWSILSPFIADKTLVKRMMNVCGK